MTQFRNIETPYNFSTNRAIRFKFGKEMENGPSLRNEHKLTPIMVVAKVT